MNEIGQGVITIPVDLAQKQSYDPFFVGVSSQIFAILRETSLTIEHIRFLKPDIAFVDATQKINAL